MTHRDDATASRRGDSHQLVLSRRASDAVRGRAAELSRSLGSFLDQVIAAGLGALTHLEPRVSQHQRNDDEQTETT